MVDAITDRTEAQEASSLLVDISAISEENIQSLKGRVQRNNGLVRLFIHPDYIGYSQYEQEWFDAYGQQQHLLNAQRLQNVDEGFLRTLRSTSPLKPAMFVFLEPRYRENLRSKIALFTSDPVYLVDTEAGNPTPLNGNNQNSSVDRDEAWKSFRDFLGNIDVKRVLVSGAELYIGKGGEEEPTLEGCLGVSIHQLRPRFDVEVSALTYPGRRLDLATPHISVDPIPLDSK